MAASRKSAKAVDADPETKPKAEDENSSEAPDDIEIEAGGASGKKSLSAKEPPQFLWKIVGRSGHHILTLFKAVEREDADAQFERLTREGYYQDLQVLDINAVIKQPPPPKPVGESRKSVGASAKKSIPTRPVVRAPVIAKFRATAASRARSKAATNGAAGKSSAKKTSKSSGKSAAKPAAKPAANKKSSSKKTSPRQAAKKKKK